MRLEHWLYKLPLQLRSMFRHRQVERELDEEMQYHLEMKTEQLIDSGMPPDDARKAALRAMDGLELRKEQCRDARGIRWLEEFSRDSVYAFRMLKRNPGFTLAAVMTLALSIGANTAIFSIVNVIFLRPLPFTEPDRLVYISENSKLLGLSPYAASKAYIAWKNKNQVLSDIGGYMGTEANWTGRGEAERVKYANVTASLFPMLGIRPFIGRNFLPEEDRPGGQPVVIMSYDSWLRKFGADPSAVGKQAILDGKGYIIVGVLPQDFQLPDRVGDPYALWMPFAMREADPAYFTLVQPIGRLNPGVSIAAAQDELDAILQPTLVRREGHVVLTTWHDEIVGDVRPSLLVFLAAVGFVLLIACVNVANLMLARGAARQSEIGIRRALGAGKARILRQLITESLILSLSGGILGLLFAVWVKDFLVAFISTTLPSMGPVRMDHRVLAFTFLLSLFTGLAFGLAPALQSSGIRVNGILKKGRGTAEGSTGHRLRNVLVVTEIALAFVLLIGAGLLVRSFMRVRAVDPGFRLDRILSLSIDLTESKYPRPADQAHFFKRVAEQIRTLPGVAAVGLNTCLPLAGHHR